MMYFTLRLSAIAVISALLSVQLVLPALAQEYKPDKSDSTTRSGETSGSSR